MKRAYLYPISAFTDQQAPNEYLEGFMDGLGRWMNFLNREHPSNKGFLDLLGYFRKIDVVFLNWIEDLPDKRGGWIQTTFFIFMTFMLKLLKVKIVWVLHNKQSHYKTNLFLKRVVMRVVIRQSDLILTHAREGLLFLKERGVDIDKKARYFAHPLEKKKVERSETPSLDILIWGSIIPYKGIDKFLSFLHDTARAEDYRILLAGKVKPADYTAVIRALCNDFIQLDDRFVPEKELESYMADAKLVLFTYGSESVLSSGALMDSLSYGLNVLGPHMGAFRDAQEDGLITTYEGFEDLIEKIAHSIRASEDISERIDLFIGQHDWNHFSEQMITWINELD